MSSDGRRQGCCRPSERGVWRLRTCDAVTAAQIPAGRPCPLTAYTEALGADAEHVERWDISSRRCNLDFLQA